MGYADVKLQDFAKFEVQDYVDLLSAETVLNLQIFETKKLHKFLTDTINHSELFGVFL